MCQLSRAATAVLMCKQQAALQQLRATTERRRSKLEARWTARLSSEAEAHSAAVERQRVLARQLQEDCDALRDKGDAFESQAAKARAGRATDCDAGVHYSSTETHMMRALY
jgi:excinuclease UvrABC nuclease subunit